jgi:hypothetical protein
MNDVSNNIDDMVQSSLDALEAFEAEMEVAQPKATKGKRGRPAQDKLALDCEDEGGYGAAIRQATRIKSAFNAKMTVTRKLTGYTQYLQGLPKEMDQLVSLFQAYDRYADKDGLITDREALRSICGTMTRAKVVKVRKARNNSHTHANMKVIEGILRNNLSPKACADTLLEHYIRISDIEDYQSEEHIRAAALNKMVEELQNVPSIKGAEVALAVSMYISSLLILIDAVADVLGTFGSAYDFLYPDPFAAATKELMSISLEDLDDL